MRLALAIASVLAALSSPAVAQSDPDQTVRAMAPAAGKARRPSSGLATRSLQSSGGPSPAMLAVLEPPTSFVRPFAGPVVERLLPITQARTECAKRGVRADACSWASKGSCYIVIPSAGAPVSNLAAYRRHEIAHCNGWNH
jgi:hypothetical protein